jgi:hypothetical protein
MDIERMLETNAAVVVLVTLGLGVLHDRRWLTLTGIAAGFLLQHTLQGWCPPVAVVRRTVRTESETFGEITALRVLRGDFKPANSPADAIAQARALHPNA